MTDTETEIAWKLIDHYAAMVSLELAQVVARRSKVELRDTYFSTPYEADTATDYILLATQFVFTGVRSFQDCFDCINTASRLLAEKNLVDLTRKFRAVIVPTGEK